MSSSHVSAPKTGDEAPKIRLYLCDRNGEENYQFPPESIWVNCAVKAVSICRAILKAELVGRKLSEATRLYGVKSQDARFHDSVLIAQQTEKFISIFCQDFLRLYVDDSIDDSITSSLVLRRHVERSWVAEFKPSDHRFYLNGEKFRNMCSAASKSEYNADSQNWFFLFASFLVREVTHVFLDTYLPNGIDIKLPSQAFTLMEKLLFGGILYFSHDPNLETCDKIVPLLTIEDSAWRISQASIDKTLKEDIHLPYITNGCSEDGRITMRADQLYRALSAFRRSPPDSTLGA